MPDLRTVLTETQRAEIRDAISAHRLWNGRCEACGAVSRRESDHMADVVIETLAGLPGVAVVDAEVYRVARKGLVDLTEAWAELRMDTPEDQSLHDRLVALSRVAADLLPLPKVAD